MPELTYTQATIEAFREEMRRDPKVFHLCGGLGPLASLIPEFGEQRVRVCPISESAYVGAAVGAAGAGFRRRNTRLSTARTTRRANSSSTRNSR